MDIIFYLIEAEMAITGTGQGGQGGVGGIELRVNPDLKANTLSLSNRITLIKSIIGLLAEESISKKDLLPESGILKAANRATNTPEEISA